MFSSADIGTYLHKIQLRLLRLLCFPIYFRPEANAITGIAQINLGKFLVLEHSLLCQFFTKISLRHLVIKLAVIIKLYSLTYANSLNIWRYNDIIMMMCRRRKGWRMTITISRGVSPHTKLNMRFPNNMEDSSNGSNIHLGNSIEIANGYAWYYSKWK